MKPANAQRKFEQLPEEQRRQYLFAAARNGWLARNPTATPREVEGAMARLRKEVGI